MGVFDWLFGEKPADGPTAYDSAGPIVFVTRGAGDTLIRPFAKDGRQVVVLGHDEERLVDRIAASSPACLVLQVESTGPNGFVVTKWVKKDGRLTSIPLIIFSTEAGHETFEQHQKLRTHADAYVAAADPQALHDAVLQLLSSSALA